MHGKSITIFFSYLPSHEVLDFYIGKNKPNLGKNKSNLGMN